MYSSELPSSAMEWKKRYLQIEGKLKHFRIKAANIKLKLSQEMEELTIKCEQAEAKAEDAEYQLNLLRDNLAGIPGAAEQQERFCRDKMADLDRRSSELQERNSILEKQLEYERYLRQLDRDALHEKAVRIKEWVTQALSSAEKKNQELKNANDRLTAAVHAMQQRLTELHEIPSPLKPAQSTPATVYQSKWESPRESGTRDHACEDPDVEAPQCRESMSSPINKQWQGNPLFKPEPALFQPRSNNSDESDPFVASQSPSPGGMETDASVYGRSPESDLSAQVGSDYYATDPKSSASERGGSRLDESASKSACETDVYSESSPSEPVTRKPNKKKSSTFPLTTPNTSPQNTPSTSHTHHNFSGPFGSIRRRFKGLTDHHPKHRSHEDSTNNANRGRDKRDKLRSKSKSPAPRSLSSPRTRSPPLAVATRFAEPNRSGSSSPTPQASTSQEDESMLVDLPTSAAAMMKPSVFFSTSLPGDSPSWRGLQVSMRPPTPPSHGLPSWETKIYDMTKTGFRLPSNVFSKGSSSKHALSLEYEPCDFVHIVCKTSELNVPVYTKLKGKVTRIRRSPFTDASDSSDDECRSSTYRRFSPRRHSRSSRNLVPSGEVVPASPSSVATQQWKNGSPGLARAIKRGNSQHSMASSEGDYSIPPDAVFSWSASPPAHDSSEPEHKLLKTSKHQSTPSVPRSGPAPLDQRNVVPEPECQEPEALKCGYLTKLSGRVRAWRKRWFVLRNGSLYYYKTANVVGQKPQGEIALTGSDEVKLKRESDGPTFRVTCGKRTYYLSADSSNSARDWVQALLGVVEGNETPSDSDGLPCASGWITRTVGGSSCRVWAVMRNGMLEFYESEDTCEMPLSRLSIASCAIEAARLNLQSPSGAGHVRAHSPPPTPEHVIVVRPTSESNARDVFLTFQTEQQKSTWLRALTSVARTSSVSCTGRTPSKKTAASDDLSLGTEFERIIAKIVQNYSKSSRSDVQDACSSIWKNPVLAFSKQGISRPLTTLCSEAMQTEAMKIAKSIHAFANLSVDAASVDYHVTLAQGIAQSCLTHVELRDELFAQLIKLTNRRDSEISDDDLSYLQSWMLMALIIPLFLPRDKLLCVLRSHFKRHAKSKTEMGQYVTYCQRSLERTVALGDRSAAPSRTEALSILLHKPYRHSLPFSMPVHFADGSYQVISFDGSSTVSEFSYRAAVQSKIRHQTTSGFALYVNDPLLSGVVSEHYVEPTAKICDIISSWESHSRLAVAAAKGLAVRSTHDGAAEQGRASVRFIFKRRLDFKAYRRLETESEKILLVYQIADEISRDRFPLSRDLAIELAALGAQVHCGDKPRDPASGDDFNHVIKCFLPARYREGASRHQQKQTRARVSECWAGLRGTTPSDAVRIFLNTARKWPLCGSSMFLAKNETNGKHKGDTVWLAVTDDGLNILHHRTMEVTDRCEYADVVTFGGCIDDFMVVTEMAGVSRKQFFALGKVQMYDLVRLMADYMNASPSSGPKLRSPAFSS